MFPRAKRTLNNALGPDSDIITPDYCPPDGCRHLTSPVSTSAGQSSLQAEECPDVAIQPQSEPQSEPEFRLRTDPFVIPSRTIPNFQRNRRQWIWLSPWSTWSFTVRLMLTLGEKLRPGSPSLPQNVLDTEVYEFPWPSFSASEVNISGLPSLNHALYLFTTVKFHLGQTYRLFDEVEFESEIKDFYANAVQNVSQYRVWFIKFLLVLAFGTAFHTSHTTAQEPPGARFFSRAMALMPGPGCMWKESMLGIEILAMAGLYLFCIDDRESAHCYLSNAIRIAQMEGLHTQLPQEELGAEKVTHCRDLWWTLYIMDRHFSSSLGLPMSVQDGDITTPVNPPNVGSQSDSARSLQVNLSHLMSIIVTTVYLPARTPLTSFLEQTRSILHTLAHHAQEIERIIRLKFDNSPGAMPRETHYLTMLYHQCVIFATRPPLLAALKERSELLGHPDDENWDGFLAQTATVISAGIKSAAKTLQILSKEYSMLEVFLPYDVEFAFGAALHLTMASAVFPDVVDYQHCRHLSHQILHELVSRGNRIARARTAELKYLETLCAELAVQGRRQGHQTLTLSHLESEPMDVWGADAGNEARLTVGDQNLGAGMPEPDDSLQDLGHNTSSNMDLLNSIGISADNFFSIIQQMPDPETLSESILDWDLWKEAT
ncbi:Zn(II)2Cys6 transcription factor [Metarhizium robertsii ARSEF 23]|uniref:Zn(II)2Cys6 transcription factor n=1 Tax=Metarhizium robertsii (strain ARSEF 23 / ATCC MYA-3075) TaxID=655844 RepID=E9F1T8_METRA|nr:Zn(II)2Cys6 transcription factor [Metarhizium robertsii ARSEF 23]EFY98027.2 Zn(II)2Cys6 transcription factor [Metarhizium robertsii ARSEF 23]